MSNRALDLYELLPAVYRIRDAEQGYPLRALLDIIGQQVDILKEDIDGLWDDLFIETSAEWVIPYIGDLVGNNPLYEVVRGRRADVAKTIYYRRRKGVLPMLEELARDVTGWWAHAVAAFANLGWTQNLDHLRMKPAPNPNNRFPNAVSRVGTVNLRDVQALEKIDGPFDILSHTLDIRPASRAHGWHNVPKINFFLWRLYPFRMTAVPARLSSGFSGGFHFSPLGKPTPLFNDPELERSETELASEKHIPGPIRPAAFYFRMNDYYGPTESLAIYRGSTADSTNLVPRSDILCKDLSTWEAPPAGKVAVDVHLGRVAFASGEVPADVTVTYNYGFSAPLGGGPYNRRDTLRGGDPDRWQVRVAKDASVSTLQQALNQWEAAGMPDGVIQITDSGRYGGPFRIRLPAGGRLVIEATDGQRPVVHPVANRLIYAPDGDADIVLNGLVIEGGLQLCGDVRLTITHCTLVPGRELNEDGSPRQPDLDSLVVTTVTEDDVTCDTFADLEVIIDKSIVGPLRLPAKCQGLTVRDSIVDAPTVDGTRQPAIAAADDGTPGPPLQVNRSTVWGAVHARSLHASEVIFNHEVQVERQQIGCVRFSYLPEGSVTPQRYRCQPDLALAEARRESSLLLVVLPPEVRAAILARLRPDYTSFHFGDPGYAQLSPYCAEEIRTGAADGAEMGVFNMLKQPQRETNLRIRLREYLPFGLEPGLIYVT
jgi:hypothetical protein